jgi:hypothetical protein
VPQRSVADGMGKHVRKLILILRREECPRRYKDVPAWQRERLRPGATLDYIKLIVEYSILQTGHKFRPYAANIRIYGGVRERLRSFANL